MGELAASRELAELEGLTDEAIANYTRAMELGNTQPAVSRRLVGLLSQRNDSGRIDRVFEMLSERGAATGNLTVTLALAAIRQQDFDRGIALARQVFSESSTDYGDHLFLGQFYLAAPAPRRRQRAAPRSRARPGGSHHVGELRPISGS